MSNVKSKQHIPDFNEDNSPIPPPEGMEDLDVEETPPAIGPEMTEDELVTTPEAEGLDTEDIDVEITDTEEITEEQIEEGVIDEEPTITSDTDEDISTAEEVDAPVETEETDDTADESYSEENTDVDTVVEEDVQSGDDTPNTADETVFVEEEPKGLVIPEQLFNTELPVRFANADNYDDRVKNKTLRFALIRRQKKNDIIDHIVLNTFHSRTGDTAAIWEEGYGDDTFGCALLVADKDFYPKEPIFVRPVQVHKDKTHAIVPLMVGDHVLMSGKKGDKIHHMLYMVSKIEERSTDKKKEKKMYKVDLQLVMYNDEDLYIDYESGDQVPEFKDKTIIKRAVEVMKTDDRVAPCYVQPYTRKYTDIGDYQQCVRDIPNFKQPEVIAHTSVNDMYEAVDVRANGLFAEQFDEKEIISVMTILNPDVANNCIVVFLITVIYDFNRKTSNGRRYYLDRTTITPNSEDFIYIDKFFGSDRSEVYSFESLMSALTEGAEIYNFRKNC